MCACHGRFDFFNFVLTWRVCQSHRSIKIKMFVESGLLVSKVQSHVIKIYLDIGFFEATVAVVRLVTMWKVFWSFEVTFLVSFRYFWLLMVCSGTSYRWCSTEASCSPESSLFSTFRTSFSRSFKRQLDFLFRIIIMLGFELPRRLCSEMKVAGSSEFFGACVYLRVEYA